MMRLSFANGEHPDHILQDGSISLGNANGNTLVLHGEDVAPWHARFTVDARGIVLDVLDPAARTHVNARPVREGALLRLGDTVCLGRVAMTVKIDRDDAIARSIPPENGIRSPMSPPRVLLRGVSGNHFGKTMAVNDMLLVGRAPGCDLRLDDPRVAERHASIESSDSAIWMRNLGGSEGAVVNGVPVRDAMLHAGDQIGFGASLFVVEAPGFPPRGESASARADTEAAAGRPDSAGTPARTASDGGAAVWWLLGAAAVIACSLLLLIHRGF